MNIIKKITILLLSILFMACNSDDDGVVQNQNQAPVLADSSINLSETLTSDIITTIEATDPEGDALTYSIVSQNPSGSVSINPNTGVVYVANASAFDYSVNQVITVTIMVTDGINETTAQLTINIIED